MTYNEYKRAFIARHSACNWRVVTSPMVDDTYVKNYIFEDGAVLSEINSIESLHIPAAVDINDRAAHLLQDRPIFVTECFNTDDPKSYKWYEAV